MNQWIATGEAVLPIFGLIALGAVLRRLPLLDEKGWAGLDRIVYWVFFPALLFASVARADLQGVAVGWMAAAMIGTVVAMTALLYVVSRFLGAGKPARASLVMGGIRFNTFLGVAIAEQTYGATGVTLAAICIAIMVPTVNVISVWTLQQGTPGGGILRTVGSLFQNPLILACLFGAVVNLARVEPEPVLMTAVDLLGQASLPLGLIAVGAGLTFDTLRTHGRLLATGIVAKMLIQPALGFGFLLAAGLSAPTLVIALMWLALPAAPSSYVMARTLGGDAPLMAALLTAQVIVAVVTLPLLLGFLS
ncbi:MAG: AEC family transporter [Minwuia sp.]|uniref:AEC family transporter n=1 Tax=Minwuia sp. TaxID=2493630 RepID=UPI003A8A7D02